jgi:hypothetical protein
MYTPIPLAIPAEPSPTADDSRLTGASRRQAAPQADRAGPDVFRRLLCAACQFVLALLLVAIPLASRAETPASIDMKMLVLSAQGTEPSFFAITAVLDQIGVPYDVLIATQAPFTARTLSDGAGHGHYQAIFLATGNLGYQDASSGQFLSALSQQQWQTLRQYEASFRVRQVTMYTYPEDGVGSYGLTTVTGVSTSTTPLTGRLTPRGQQVFGYMNPAAVVSIRNAWVYEAKPTSASNPVPLLTTPQGYVLASIYTSSDGRQNLALTMDGNPFLLHTMELGYGVVNWASKGFFLGARAVYLNPQVDDMFIADDIWNPATLTDTSGQTFRLSGNDLQQVLNWQSGVNGAAPTSAQLTLEIAFNGIGTTGIFSPDTLTPVATANQQFFNWTSHTYDHANLDNISYADALAELQNNDIIANQLNLWNYSGDSLVQPDESGLNNPDFLQAVVDDGYALLIADNSMPQWQNPSPNAGFYSQFQPSVFISPRTPTNLYYNVSTPTEWTSEYNYFYAPNGLFPTFNHALSYSEILDTESSIILSYLLTYNADPLMFHQPNLSTYDGTHFLLGDLINAVLTKYKALFKLPISSPGQDGLAAVMANRMDYNASGATGVLSLGASNRITLNTVNGASIPLTGISYGDNSGAYGGQAISFVTLTAGGSVAIPGPSW